MSTQRGESTPTPVTASWILWLIGAVIAIIAGVLALLLGIALVSEDFTDASVREAHADGVSGIMIIILAGVIILLALLVISYANGMRRGERPARTILTVIGVLMVIANIWQEGSAQQGGGVTVTVGGGALITIIAIVLMWVPSANRYFDGAAPAPTETHQPS